VIANNLSEHFTFHPLTAGVWAALAKPTGLAASNAGIVDLGEQTLIFDTTYSPASATELRAAAESLTGRPVNYVLNSHWHSDHIYGNAVFAPETKIYATAYTRETMAEKTPATISEFKTHWPEQLQEWAAKARAAQTEAERLDYEDGVRFAQAIIHTFPQLELRLPDHTFSERVEFKGSRRTAEFITLGGGHTASDALLHLPAEQIIFTGDLLVVKNHPDLTYGDPHTWLTILAQITALAPQCLLPGHGELGTLIDVALIERYLRETLQLAEEHRRADGTAESAVALPPPAFTEGWSNAEAFGRNMKFLYEDESS